MSNRTHLKYQKHTAQSPTTRPSVTYGPMLDPPESSSTRPTAPPPRLASISSSIVPAVPVNLAPAPPRQGKHLRPLAPLRTDGTSTSPSSGCGRTAAAQLLATARSRLVRPEPPPPGESRALLPNPLDNPPPSLRS
jgi:hypothetical protein